MRILLEEHQYESSKVKDVLWEGAFQDVDNFVSIKYVGYFYNTHINDCVFILPKVLMDLFASLIFQTREEFFLWYFFCKFYT